MFHPVNISQKKTFLKLSRLGFSPKKILDIGAYHGWWSIQMKNEVFTEAEYTLIEAIDYKELNRLKNMEVYIALLDSEKRERIWYEGRNTGDSMYKERTAFYNDCKIVKRETTTLDILLPDKQYDLIKIDTQGAEIPILLGGKKIMEKTAFIMLEIPFVCQYNEGTPDFSEHITFMKNNNFVVFDIMDQHRPSNILIQVDILFIHKDHYILPMIQELIDSNKIWTDEFKRQKRNSI
jgi:FkbM family methyltransferase